MSPFNTSAMIKMLLVSGIIVLMSNCTAENEIQPSKELSDVQSKAIKKKSPKVSANFQVIFTKVVAGQGPQFYTMDQDGANQTNITNGFTPINVMNRSTHLSLDGTKLLFPSWDENGKIQVFIINIDGSGLQQLTSSGENYYAFWSPDNEHIVYLSTRDGNEELYSMKFDGSEIKNLTQSPGSSEGFPRWSPDGQKICFYSDRAPHEGDFEIYVMDDDGSNQRQVTTKGLGDNWARWMYDSERIFFERDLEDGNRGIFSIKIDGTNEILLVGEGYNRNAQPSPDMENFLFSRDGALFLKNINGIGDERQITNYEGIFGGIWIQHGNTRSIIFSKYADEYESSNIFIMNEDGTNQVNLSNSYDNDWEVGVSRIKL